MKSSSFLISPNGSIPVETVKVNEQLKVGDILVGNFGYEANLAVFVKVTKVMKNSVKVMELDQIRTGGWMEGTSSPNLGSTKGTEVLRKVKVTSYGKIRVGWNSYTNLYKWDGKPVHTYNHH